MAANSIFAKKSVKDPHEQGETIVPPVLNWWDLTALGIGAIIGAGIFVLTGNASAQYAGPAIVLSFIVSGIGCAFAGLCYAEMASMIPKAGSAYTYSYITMGELLAWIIGWDLVLEYSFGAATVSVGWSGYVVSLLRDIGIMVPPELIAAPGTHLILLPGEGWKELTEALAKLLAANGIDSTTLPHATAIFNLPAVLIVLAVTGLLVVGIKESVNVNNCIVILKVVILSIFVVAGGVFLFRHREIWDENWKEFIPPNKGEFGEFGRSGIFRAAGVIFFAYIGFDAVSTAAQEAKNPQRDMPIGILGSLAICTVIYILVSCVLTGIVHYTKLNVADPVAVGIDATGLNWLRYPVKIGAIGGLTSVILVMLLAQPRIFWTMARDGLLPMTFAKIHRKFKTPYITTILTGLAVAAVAAVVPIHILGGLVSIGTLLAFVLVCAGVSVLRITNPDIPRPFKTPFVHVTAVLGILVCLAQMFALPLDTWIRLVVWMAIGLVIYFAYGYHHSALRAPAAVAERGPPLEERIEPAQEGIMAAGDQFKPGTGAICGQLAGAHWGESNIPESLKSGLARMDMLEKALAGIIGE